jgi:hypothetical protein
MNAYNPPSAAPPIPHLQMQQRHKTDQGGVEARTSRCKYLAAYTDSLPSSSPGRSNMPSYPVLAQTLSEHPALQIFRTYSALNIKSILYYQAELAYLEAELAEVEAEDQACPGPIRNKFAQDWWYLRYGTLSDPSLARPPSPASSIGQSCACSRSRNRSVSPLSQARRGASPGRPTVARQWMLMCRIREVLESYCENSISPLVAIAGRP